MVCVKSYQLQHAMQDFSAAVVPSTAILPLLGGISHLGALRDRFGHKLVLGGMFPIIASSEGQGRIALLLKPHELVLGELDGEIMERVSALRHLFSPAKLDTRVRQSIMLDMWKKFTLLASGCQLNAAPATRSQRQAMSGQPF